MEKNKVMSILLMVMMLVTSLFAMLVPHAEAKAESSDALERTYADFEGKDIAVITGSLTYLTSEKIGATPVYYSDASAAAEDVRRGRVDGFMAALSTVRIMAYELGNDTFEVIPVPKEFFAGQVGGISMDQELIDRFNEFLSIIKADGTLEEMERRWFSDTPDLEAPMPEIANSGENGVLRVATSADSLPYVYFGANGELKGFSVELVQRFGAYEGKEIEFSEMEFGGLIPYMISRKADFSLAAMAITEERKQSVLFTDPIIDEPHGILALSGDGGAVPIDAPQLSYGDFAEKRLGVVTGTVGDVVAEHYLDALPVYYTEFTGGIEDVRKGRIDGFIQDTSASRVFVSMPGNEGLETVQIPESIFTAPMGAISMDQDMIGRFNLFLAECKADGTLEEMQDRWLKTVPDLDAPMPDLPLTGENGMLKVATYSGSLPFAYMGANNELKGYSIELARRFAAHEGMDIEFADMDFAGLIPYVLGGRADFGIANISITEERKQSVLFTDSIYDDTLSIITLRADGGAPAETGGGFLDWLITGIEKNLVTDNRWRMIVDGLGVTMTIAFSAQILGTAFASLVCFVLTRKNKLVRGIGTLYCGLIHGTPIVVLLMITYYIIFGDTEVSNVFVAVVAFTMVTAAGIAKNLKAAMDTVDPVEIEAARSIGFSAFGAFRTVTLPQAIRRALPAYTNGFVELVKATAVVGYIAIQDLTRAADIIRSRTFDAFFPLLLIAAIYLIVTTACILLFRFVVNRINGGVIE